MKNRLIKLKMSGNDSFICVKVKTTIAMMFCGMTRNDRRCSPGFKFVSGIKTPKGM